MFIGKIYSSALFKFNKNNNTFIGFLSDTPEVVGQLYRHEALTKGFGIQSEKTGQIAYFKLHQKMAANRTGDEAWAWLFIAADQTRDDFPQLQKTQVCIFRE